MKQPRSRHWQINGERRAYTLVELLIVVVIMGIVAAVGIPLFGESLAKINVEAAAERIRADLELARRHAINTSTSQAVEFDSDGYALPGMEDPDHPGQPYYVNLTGDQYGVTLDSVGFGGDAKIVFNRHGMPDSTGSVVIGGDNHKKTVSVDPYFNRVKVDDNADLSIKVDDGSSELSIEAKSIQVQEK